LYQHLGSYLGVLWRGNWRRVLPWLSSLLSIFWKKGINGKVNFMLGKVTAIQFDSFGKIWPRFHCLHQKLCWNLILTLFGPLFLVIKDLLTSKAIKYTSWETFQLWSWEYEEKIQSLVIKDSKRICWTYARSHLRSKVQHQRDLFDLISQNQNRYSHFLTSVVSL